MEEQKKKKFFRIPKEFVSANGKLVSDLSEIGCTDKEIGKILSIPTASVISHFREYIDKGRGSLRCSLRKAQIRLAIDNLNPSMLVWLGKCYLDQREPKHDIEHSGGFTIERIVYGDKD